jgi:hypothetical protein
LDFAFELVYQVFELAAFAVAKQIRKILKNVCCCLFEDFVTLDFFEVNQVVLASIVDLIFKELVAVLFL